MKYDKKYSSSSHACEFSVFRSIRSHSFNFFCSSFLKHLISSLLTQIIVFQMEDQGATIENEMPYEGEPSETTIADECLISDDGITDEGEEVCNICFDAISSKVRSLKKYGKIDSIAWFGAKIAQ